MPGIKFNDCDRWPCGKKPSLAERSFTLVESVIAVGILAFVLLELTNLQGNAIYFSDFGSSSQRAIMLARRVLSQVEYQWEHQEFSNLEYDKDEEFVFPEYKDDPRGPFSYRLQILNWQLPLFEILTQGIAGQSEQDKESEGSSSDSEKQAGVTSGLLEQYLGKDLLKVAHVEVFWGEGKNRDSVELTLLLTNQKKLESLLPQFKGEWQRIKNRNKKSNQTNKNNQTNENKNKPRNNPAP